MSIVIIAALMLSASVAGTLHSPPTTVPNRKSTNNTVEKEMLVPLNSTTALSCAPLLNAPAANPTATWYRDGQPIANVTINSNVVLDNRRFDNKIPQIGFLIVANIQLTDEGVYWCWSGSRRGIRSRLRVAFLRSRSDAARLGQSMDYGSGAGGEARLTLDCPPADGRPQPTISWTFNDEPLNLANGRYSLTGPKLTIHRYRNSEDAGSYECVWSNLAGRTVALAVVDTPDRGHFPTREHQRHITVCYGYFRNEVLWFLIGCLSTCCVVLLYLIACTLFAKCSKRGRRRRYEHGGLLVTEDAPRATGRLAALHRLLDTSVNANRLPGFRKVVAPAPAGIAIARPGA